MRAVSVPGRGLLLQKHYPSACRLRQFSNLNNPTHSPHDRVGSSTECARVFACWSITSSLTSRAHRYRHSFALGLLSGHFSRVPSRAEEGPAGGHGMPTLGKRLDLAHADQVTCDTLAAPAGRSDLFETAATALGMAVRGICPCPCPAACTESLRCPCWTIPRRSIQGQSRASGKATSAPSLTGPAQHAHEFLRLRPWPCPLASAASRTLLGAT